MIKGTHKPVSPNHLFIYILTRGAAEKLGYEQPNAKLNIRLLSTEVWGSSWRSGRTFGGDLNINTFKQN